MGAYAPPTALPKDEDEVSRIRELRGERKLLAACEERLEHSPKSPPEAKCCARRILQDESSFVEIKRIFRVLQGTKDDPIGRF